MVLWELLTGHQYLQISGLDPAAALALVRHPKPTPPSARAPWITPVLDHVLIQALAPDRGKRYQSAEEFRHALSEAIAECAPRTDAARVSELMHSIYQKVIAEENAERESFMKEILPSFRAAHTPTPVTPTEDDPPIAAPSKGKASPSGAERRAGKRAAAMQVLAELAKESGGN